MDISQFTQLGAVTIVFLLFVKEFFSYLKTLKQNGSNPGERLTRLEEKVDLIMHNHLHDIKDWMKGHQEEHKSDRELLIKIASKLDIK